MNRFFKFILCFLILPTAFATTSSPNQQLGQLLKNIYSMKGSFKQTIYNANGKVVQAMSGRMVLQRPNKFRWDIQTPNKQVIVADGRNLWVYNVPLKQVSVQPLKRNLANTPALLLSASSNVIANYFNVETKGNWFYLTAKSPKNMFQQIKIQFNGNILREMQMTDNLGQSGVLQFSSLHINSPLNDQTFEFKLPKDVDVVGQPK